MTEQELVRANQLSQQAGVWLGVDNRYLNQLYSPRSPL